MKLNYLKQFKLVIKHYKSKDFKSRYLLSLVLNTVTDDSSQCPMVTHSTTITYNTNLCDNMLLDH